MSDFGEKLIELRIATRGACNFERGKGCAVTLRTKALYLLSKKPRSPIELMERLCMVKSNLALLAGKMVEDGAAEKLRGSEDRRVISYRITEKGEAELAETLAKLEEKFKGIFSTDKQKEESMKKFDDLLDLLSFI